MDLALANKAVLITGASGGMGRALAEAFAAEGCLLGLHGSAHLDELRSWVSDQPWRERAVVVPADISRLAEVESAVATVAAAFGRVDVCIANAGVWPPEDRPLHTLPEERLRRTLEVNLLGAAWTARAFLQSLARSGPRADGQGSALIFIGSTAGRFGEAGHADYAASKAGLAGLVRTLKNEIVDLDPFGRVNMIEPGWTVTHMARPALSEPGRITGVLATMPLRQLGRAADIARTALWLASPAMARHVSGEIISVAGGMEGRVRWDADQVDEQAVRRRLDEEGRAPRVLFVCVENSCRSQLAEGLARMRGMAAYSAGSKPSGRVNPKAVAAMAELGYDLTRHASKGVADLPALEFDAAITMGCGDACPAVPARLRDDWDVPDPKAMNETEFRALRDDIAKRIDALTERLGILSDHEG